MTVIAIIGKVLQYENDILSVTHYPLHMADRDIHRPFSHRYSVFEQLRYCEAIE